MTNPVPRHQFCTLLVGISLLVLSAPLAGCGGSSTGASEPTSVRSSPVLTTMAAPTAPSAPAAPQASVTTTEVPTTTESFNLPAGYPRVVTVSSLPNQVRNWMQMQGDTQAVALAPGVWTPLPTGASVADAVNSNVADGFCASVHDYETNYLGGQQMPGACW